MTPSSLIPADAPELVRASTLARWFNVSQHAIWYWVERGILPEPIRLAPRTNWFKTAEVIAFLDRQSQPAVPETKVDTQ